MDNSALIVIASAASTILAAFWAYRSSRNATAVNQDANNIQWVKQAREVAAAAEAKAENAEQRADAFSVRIRTMERQLVSLESRVRFMVMMIHDPYMTMQILRVRIPEDFAEVEHGK